VTQSEWLECTDPQPMLESLRGKTTERKLRLFAVACCRRIWHLLTEGRSRNAVEVAEKHADGWLTDVQLADASLQAEQAFHRTRELEPSGNDETPTIMASSAVWGATVCRSDESMIGPDEPLVGMAINTALQAEVTAEYKRQAWERVAQAALLRDIFGNPFRPVSTNPVWITPTVLNLARSAYDERIMPSGELDPARLSVLSDALEEARCDNNDMLTHLRSPGPHVRGCWAVDLVLGKE
jgi:hypothetical protein